MGSEGGDPAEIPDHTDPTNIEQTITQREVRDVLGQCMSMLPPTLRALSVLLVVTSQGLHTEPLSPAANIPGTMAAPNDGGITTLPADASTSPITGQKAQESHKIVRYQYASYILIDRTVPADQLGEVLMRSHHDKSGNPSGEGQIENPVEGDGYAPFLEPGTEIRLIKGVHPKQELAVPFQDKWYVVDSFLDTPDLKE